MRTLKQNVREAADAFAQSRVAAGGKYMITLYGTAAESKKLERAIESKFGKDLDGAIETKFRSGGSVVSFKLSSPDDKKVISLAKSHEASEVKLNLGSGGTKSLWEDD